MIERTVSLDRVAASICWVITWCLIASGWIVFASGRYDLGEMLLLSCLPPAWTAALLTVRMWATALCQTVRATARHEAGSDVTPFR